MTLRRGWGATAAFWLCAMIFQGACDQSQPAPEPPPLQFQPNVNLFESLPFDCTAPGAFPCQTNEDCACLKDFCDGVEGSVVPPDLDLSKVECCEGVCLDFSQTPVETCEDFLQIGISCPQTGAPAPECGQGSDCQAITGTPGFYTCEIFCCVTRLPQRVGEGASCLDNPFVEPQCDFGLKCVNGACQKICGDDPFGGLLMTCDQVSWFGPEATCENLGFGPCDATGCCGPPPPNPCDPFPTCESVGNDCPSVGLTGACVNPEDCCSPP